MDMRHKELVLHRPKVRKSMTLLDLHHRVTNVGRLLKRNMLLATLFFV